MPPPMVSVWWDRPLVHLAGVNLSTASAATLIGACAAVLLTAWYTRRVAEGRLVAHSHLSDLQKFLVSRFAFYGILVFGLVLVFRVYGFPVTRPIVHLGAVSFSVFTAALFLFYVLLVIIGASVASALIANRMLAASPLNPGARYAIGRLTQYLLIIIGLSMALQAVGVNLASLTVVLGALSVGLAFGTQNIVNNFVSGLIVLIERPISVGDWIEVGKSRGRVRRIGARSTTIVTSDNISLIVPNGQFINQTIVNWSHLDPRVRLRLPVGVGYASDLDLVRSVFIEVAKAHPRVLASPEPDVFLHDFGDSSIDLQLVVWTDTSAAGMAQFRSDLYFAVERACKKNGIELPFPQRVVSLARGGSESVAAQAAGPSEQPAPREAAEDADAGR